MKDFLSRPWLRWVLGLAAAILGLRYLLEPLLPFLFGLGVALAAERPVRTLTAGGMRRGAAAGLCVGAGLALAAAGLWLLLRRGLFELQALGRALPGMLGALAEPMAQLQLWLDEQTARAPDGLSAALRAGIDALFTAGPALAAQLSQRVLGWASALAGRLPGAALAAGTALVSCFLFSAELPELRDALGCVLPVRWRRGLKTLSDRLRQALGGWLRAQLKLMGITFGIVTAGLLLLGIDFALLLGALIALVDALPVFGVGTVLLPWSLLCFLRGEARQGFWLIGIYGAAALTRAILEPRLIGRQMGLPPLAALASMYLGGRFFGLTGMICAPIGAMAAVQLYRGSSGGTLPS